MPAASAVLLRDRPSGLEVLLLRRSLTASFGPGAWVFPGGRVDPGDLGDGPAAAGMAAEVAAARRAAARETAEEAGLEIDPAALVPLSRWCPPAIAPKRFVTWMLLGVAPEREVVVDGSEIIDHRWVRPGDAIAARDRGELDLMPPTWVTLWTLAQHPGTAAVLAAAGDSEPELFETQFAQTPDGLLAMWHGDVGYGEAAPDITRQGPRHRLWMLGTGWRYERAS
ncbi:MAG: NUDIX domain-containing protein [Frankia sp.]|nr:NUDIX domain-containing protein [Frankia sp.]